MVALVTLGACSPGHTLRDLRGTPATAHERYARALHDAGLDSTALGREWLRASDSALRAPLRAELPAREVGVYSRSEARAVAYQLRLREGQRLEVSLRADGPAARLYLDLFQVTGDTARPFRHRASADPVAAPDSAAAQLALTYEPGDSGTYVLRLQPELLRNGRYELTMRTAPVLAFPVEGRGNGAIQSFFGAVRDGGRRDHHGIDIFAPRGTPVLAGTDGVVRSVSPNNLGGNVVWLSDVRRGQSLYYAHLDRHYVTAGQSVRTGDTLGFVGNTGNARTTAPHLHFGIYRRGRGPVDPLPYVRQVTARVPAVAVDTSRLGAPAVVRVADAPLRSGPSSGSETVRRVPRDTPLHIVGAAADWYRIQLADGTAGYVAANSVRVSGERTRDFVGE